MDNTQKYFLRILTFDPNTIDADYVADMLLESWTGSAEQIETILDILLGTSDDDVASLGSSFTLNNEPITSDEMFAIINLLEDMRNPENEEE